VPPETVYIITNNPIIIFKVVKSHPKTEERIIAGAKIVIPAAKLL
jgi:hypothetical protein